MKQKYLLEYDLEKTLLYVLLSGHCECVLAHLLQRNDHTYDGKTVTQTSIFTIIFKLFFPLIIRPLAPLTIIPNNGIVSR